MDLRFSVVENSSWWLQALPLSRASLRLSHCDWLLFGCTSVAPLIFRVFSGCFFRDPQRRVQKEHLGPTRSGPGFLVAPRKRKPNVCSRLRSSIGVFSFFTHTRLEETAGVGPRAPKSNNNVSTQWSLTKHDAKPVHKTGRCLGQWA